MDACAPRRGPSCCPCVSFGFDLASMASGDVAIVRCHVETSFGRKTRFVKPKNSLVRRLQRAAVTRQNKQPSRQETQRSPHTLSTRSERQGWFREQPALSLSAATRKEHTPRRRKSRNATAAWIKARSAAATGKNAQDAHRARPEPGAAAAAARPVARLAEVRREVARLQGRGARREPRRRDRLHFGKQARHDARRARAAVPDVYGLFADRALSPAPAHAEHWHRAGV